MRNRTRNRSRVKRRSVRRLRNKRNLKQKKYKNFIGGAGGYERALRKYENLEAILTKHPAFDIPELTDNIEEEARAGALQPEEINDLVAAAAAAAPVDLSKLYTEDEIDFTRPSTPDSVQAAEKRNEELFQSILVNAETALEAGDYEEAKNLFMEAKVLNPIATYRAVAQKGMAAMQEENYVEAVKHFKRAMSLFPGMKDQLDQNIRTAKKKYNKAWGLVTMQRGDYVKAVRYFNIAMRLAQKERSSAESQELARLIKEAQAAAVAAERASVAQPAATDDGTPPETSLVAATAAADSPLTHSPTEPVESKSDAGLKNPDQTRPAAVPPLKLNLQLE